MRHFLIYGLAISIISISMLIGCGNDDERAPADIPAQELVQSECSADEDCPGGRCITGIGDGLCTANCTTQEDCPEETICTDTESSSGGVCLLSCSTGSECTEHLGSAYTCDEESDLTTGEDVRVCIDGR